MTLPTPCPDVLSEIITHLRGLGFQASSQLLQVRSGPHVRVSSPGNRGSVPLKISILLECFDHSEADSFALAVAVRQAILDLTGTKVGPVAILGAAAPIPVHFNTNDDDFHRHQIMCEMTVDPR